MWRELAEDSALQVFREVAQGPLCVRVQAPTGGKLNDVLIVALLCGRRRRWGLALRDAFQAASSAWSNSGRCTSDRPAQAAASPGSARPGGVAVGREAARAKMGVQGQMGCCQTVSQLSDKALNAKPH
mmetsp:Transcript_36584/g.101545  ORF Transcript_36584/g.101545 Transcript_36584/m.101545 type:complete len:128 (+) Transcript_36584:320-703(+)